MVTEYLAGTPVRIDKFQKAEGCLYYLCSHAHMDHTAGLTPTWNLGTLICTAGTAALLGARYGSALLEHTRTVGIGESVVLDTGGGGSGSGQCPFSLTLLDANHCPGACMFLLESVFGSILHTGDFRARPEMFEETCLARKSIDYLIVDSTFCFDRRFEFMSLAQCVDAIVSIIHTHGDGAQIWLGVDSLGREDLLISLSERLQTLIVVSTQRLEQLRLLEAHDLLSWPGARHGPPTSASIVDRFFTADQEDGFITLVPKHHMTIERLLDANRSGGRTIGIRPTGWSCLRADAVPPPLHASSDHTGCDELDAAQVFWPLSASGQRAEHAPVRARPVLFHVPYSLHSSFSELYTFVQRLRPRALFPLLQQSKAECVRIFGPLVRPPTLAVPPPPPLQSVFPAVANAAAVSQKVLCARTSGVSALMLASPTSPSSSTARAQPMASSSSSFSASIALRRRALTKQNSGGAKIVPFVDASAAPLAGKILDDSVIQAAIDVGLGEDDATGDPMSFYQFKSSVGSDEEHGESEPPADALDNVIREVIAESVGDMSHSVSGLSEVDEYQLDELFGQHTDALPSVASGCDALESSDTPVGIQSARRRASLDRSDTALFTMQPFLGVASSRIPWGLGVSASSSAAAEFHVKPRASIARSRAIATTSSSSATIPTIDPHHAGGAHCVSAVIVPAPAQRQWPVLALTSTPVHHHSVGAEAGLLSHPPRISAVRSHAAVSKPQVSSSYGDGNGDGARAESLSQISHEDDAEFFSESASLHPRPTLSVPTRTSSAPISKKRVSAPISFRSTSSALPLHHGSTDEIDDDFEDADSDSSKRSRIVKTREEAAMRSWLKGTSKH